MVGHCQRCSIRIHVSPGRMDPEIPAGRAPWRTLHAFYIPFYPDRHDRHGRTRYLLCRATQEGDRHPKIIGCNHESDGIFTKWKFHETHPGLNFYRRSSFMVCHAYVVAAISVQDHDRPGGIRACGRRNTTDYLGHRQLPVDQGSVDESFGCVEGGMKCVEVLECWSVGVLKLGRCKLNVNASGLFTAKPQ